MIGLASTNLSASPTSNFSMAVNYSAIVAAVVVVVEDSTRHFRSTVTISAFVNLTLELVGSTTGNAYVIVVVVVDGGGGLGLLF